MTENRFLSPSGAFPAPSRSVPLRGDGLDLATLDLEAYWASDEVFYALGYDEEPQPVSKSAA